ncbi:hypothetical protein, conserved [Leishmania shawi]|uniref:Proteophosphoglycan ppg4 n=1 Tax=Leishmania shawi TaxID=5680 RepID=A0ABR3E8V7_9TRYP
MDDNRDVIDLEEASFEFVWWLGLLIAAAAIGVVTGVVQAIMHWCRARRCRAEDAVRSNEIEKSICLMTARLYRTRQLWQAHQVRATQQQQHQSSPEQLGHNSLRVAVVKHPIFPDQELQVHGSLHEASFGDDEVLHTSRTAVLSSFHLHHYQPPLSYQNPLQKASVTSSSQYSVAGGGDLLTKSVSDSLMSRFSSVYEMKRVVSKESLPRSARPALPLPSPPSTRVFAGITKVGALRRALRSPQLHVESSTPPLLPTSTRCLSCPSFMLATSSSCKDSWHYQGISSFQLPIFLGAESNAESDESVLNKSSVETVSVHGPGGRAPSPRGTTDSFIEQSNDRLTRRTGVAETGRHAAVTIHGEEMDGQAAVQVQQQSGYRRATERRRLVLPSLTSPSGPHRGCKSDVTAMRHSSVAEAGRDDCAAGSTCTVPPAAQTEHPFPETSAVTLTKGGDSSFDKSLVDCTAGPQGRFTPSSFKGMKSLDSRPPLHAFLRPYNFTLGDATLPSDTFFSSSTHLKAAANFSPPQAFLHSAYTQRFMAAPQRTAASPPSSLPPEPVLSAPAESALDGTADYWRMLDVRITRPPVTPRLA